MPEPGEIWIYLRTLKCHRRVLFQLTATRLSLTSLVSRWLLMEAMMSLKSSAEINPEPSLSNCRNAAVAHSSWKSYTSTHIHCLNQFLYTCIYPNNKTTLVLVNTDNTTKMDDSTLCSKQIW